LRADIAKLERAFNPERMAVVGDSGYLQWLRGHLDFTGELLSVQVNPKTIQSIEKLGVKNYTSLLDIPGPLDFAIVAVGRGVALRVLDDLISKEVPAAHFFTAGFSETRTEEGIKLEQALKEKAEAAGFHLIGPNCMGLFNPKLGLKQGGGQYHGVHGPVGFISQSGTHALNFALEARLHGMNVSKSVSFGNGTVLDAGEYLEYLGQDDETRIIGMYLEGIREGPRFLEVLREVSVRKPVVIWKGGRTSGGARAIASHTGSLAMPLPIWQATMKQYGAVSVRNMEEMIDTIKALLFLPPIVGDRVAITGGSGGQSVAITDSFMEAGLEVPRLTQESYDELATFFSLIGGDYGNPIDTGNSNRAQLVRIMDIIEQDANVDNIVMLMGLGMGGGPQDDDATKSSPPQDRAPGGADSVIALQEKTLKPVVAVVSAPFTTGAVQEARRIMKKLQENGIPGFVNIERAATALRHAIEYHRYRSVAEG
jgi:acyl-CoA synthetase (NDP forming)